jgi:hypothetical protein
MDSLRQLPDVLDGVPPRSNPFLAPKCKLLLSGLRAKPTAVLHLMQMVLDKTVEVEFKGSIVEPRLVRIFFNDVDVIKALYDCGQVYGDLPKWTYESNREIEVVANGSEEDWEAGAHFVDRSKESTADVCWAEDSLNYTQKCLEAIKNDPEIAQLPSVKRNCFPLIETKPALNRRPTITSSHRDSLSAKSDSTGSLLVTRASIDEFLKTNWLDDSTTTASSLDMAFSRPKTLPKSSFSKLSSSFTDIKTSSGLCTSFAFQSLVIPTGSLRCCVSSIESPSAFYVQLKDSEKDLDALLNQIDAMCQEQEDGNLTLVREGMPCLAKYSLDNSWYRGEVVMVRKSGDIEICFVDFGNREILPNISTRVRPISEELLLVPVQSVLCRLANLKYKDGLWSSESNLAFEQKLTDVEVFVKFCDAIPSNRRSTAFPVIHEVEVGTKESLTNISHFMLTEFGGS